MHSQIQLSLAESSSAVPPSVVRSILIKENGQIAEEPLATSIHTPSNNIHTYTQTASYQSSQSASRDHSSLLSYMNGLDASGEGYDLEHQSGISQSVTNPTVGIYEYQDDNAHYTQENYRNRHMYYDNPIVQYETDSQQADYKYSKHFPVLSIICLIIVVIVIIYLVYKGSVLLSRQLLDSQMLTADGHQREDHPKATSDNKRTHRLQQNISYRTANELQTNTITNCHNNQGRAIPSSSEANLKYALRRRSDSRRAFGGTQLQPNRYKGDDQRYLYDTLITRLECIQQQQQRQQQEQQRQHIRHQDSPRQQQVVQVQQAQQPKTDREWSYLQSVHDSGIIKTCQNAVKLAQNDQDIGKLQLNDLRGTVQQMIQQVCANKKKADEQNIQEDANETLERIFKNKADTKYGMDEKELLKLTTKRVLMKNDEFTKQYFIEQLADANGVCGHGRATRLADVLAMSQDIPILPESLIKKRAIEKLQQLQQSNPNNFKDLFSQYLNDLETKKIINTSQLNEFQQWTDQV